MKNKNLLINAAALAAITVVTSCVANAQVIYQGGHVIQGSQTQGFAPQQGSQTRYAAPEPAYYNVDLTDAQKAQASLGVNFDDAGTGIRVRSVFTNGPGQKAGLTTGDMVTKANGSPIQNAAAFKTMIAGMKSGTSLKLTKLVEGAEKEIQCELMTMAQVIEASTVPEAGPYDQAVTMGEQQLASLRQQIKNHQAELDDMNKRYKMEEKRIADLKAKAQDARTKADQMKMMEEKKRKMEMEAMKKQADDAQTKADQTKMMEEKKRKMEMEAMKKQAQDAAK